MYEDIEPIAAEAARDRRELTRLAPGEWHAEFTARLDAAMVLARTASGQGRSEHAWTVELADPQPHLDRAVGRALADVPGLSDGGRPSELDVF